MAAFRVKQSFYCFMILVWLLSSPGIGHTGDILQGGDIPIGEDLLRIPVTSWVHLTVDVEEYRPLVEYFDHSSSLTRSLAILPSLRVAPPRQHFQPYLGAGFGLGLSGYTPHTAVAPLPLGIEESLVLHVGGGVTYHLGEHVALIGSARYAQFKTAPLLQGFSSTSQVIQEGLEFNAYTVEFGLRWAY